MIDWNNPDQRESAIAAKWAQAEDQIEVQEARIAELEAALDAVVEALQVYADPTFYHACSFMFERPTGGFDEDFGPNEDYDYDKPGKHARETLAALAALAPKESSDD
jgi:hypothetical protein